MNTPKPPVSVVMDEVLFERVRQTLIYNYSDDDELINDELAALAAVYAMPEAARDWDGMSTGYGGTLAAALTPEGYGVRLDISRRDQLIRAAALIVAEIQRIDRSNTQ